MNSRKSGAEEPEARVVTTLSGHNGCGFQNGRREEARFRFPSSLDKNSLGEIYICDQGNHLIRKLHLDGTVDTLAGTGLCGFENGELDKAEFNWPLDIAVDGNDNIVVTDYGNKVLRLVNGETGQVTTLCGSGKSGCRDGQALQAEFVSPCAVCVNKTNGDVIFTDKLASRICLLRDGQVTTISQPLFRLYYPMALALDEDGSVFVADAGRYCISRLSPDFETMRVIAGSGARGDDDGEALLSTFDYPSSLAIGPDHQLFVSDFNNHVIRCIDLRRHRVRTTAGRYVAGHNDWIGTAASFRNPYGLLFDGNSQLVLSDFGNHCIRTIQLVPYVEEYKEPAKVYRIGSIIGLGPRRRRRRRRKGLKMEDMFYMDAVQKQRKQEKLDREMARQSFIEVVDTIKQWAEGPSAHVFPSAQDVDTKGEVRLSKSHTEPNLYYHLPKETFLRTSKLWNNESDSEDEHVEVHELFRPT